MFGAETCSAASSTSTKPQRDNRRSGFRHPQGGDELVRLVYLGRAPVADALEQAGEAGVCAEVGVEDEARPEPARFQLAAGTAASLGHRLRELLRAMGQIPPSAAVPLGNPNPEFGGGCSCSSPVGMRHRPTLGLPPEALGGKTTIRRVIASTSPARTMSSAVTSKEWPWA